MSPKSPAADGSGGPDGRRQAHDVALGHAQDAQDRLGRPKRRTRQVTRVGSVFTYIPGADGRTLIFAGTEGGGAWRRARRAGAAAAVPARLRSSRFKITANG